MSRKTDRPGAGAGLLPAAASILALTALITAASGCGGSPVLQRRSAPPSAARPAASRLAAPIARRTGRVEMRDGAKIYYERLGAAEAEETVIFIHGLGGNHAVWYRQAPAFAARFDTVVYSQRGFAPSAPPPERYDVDELVVDLEDLMDALGIESARIVGQSMGGWTALGLALKDPRRVRSLVLADTLAGIFDEQIAAQYEAMIARARELGARPLPMAVHPALDPAFSAGHSAEAYLYQTLSAFGAPSPGAIAGQLGAARFSHTALAACRVPVMFVAGERDPIFPPAMIRRAAGYIPGSQVKVITGAGHSPYFETPQRWREAVIAFLDRN